MKNKIYKFNRRSIIQQDQTDLSRARPLWRYEQVGQDIKAIFVRLDIYQCSYLTNVSNWKSYRRSISIRQQDPTISEADTRHFVLTCAETYDNLGDALRTTFVKGLRHPS